MAVVVLVLVRVKSLLGDLKICYLSGGLRLPGKLFVPRLHLGFRAGRVCNRCCRMYKVKARALPSVLQ